MYLLLHGKSEVSRSKPAEQTQSVDDDEDYVIQWKFPEKPVDYFFCRWPNRRNEGNGELFCF